MHFDSVSKFCWGMYGMKEGHELQVTTEGLTHSGASKRLLTPMMSECAWVPGGLPPPPQHTLASDLSKQFPPLHLHGNVLGTLTSISPQILLPCNFAPLSDFAASHRPRWRYQHVEEDAVSICFHHWVQLAVQSQPEEGANKSFWKHFWSLLLYHSSHLVHSIPWDVSIPLPFHSPHPGTHLLIVNCLDSCSDL